MNLWIQFTIKLIPNHLQTHIKIFFAVYEKFICINKNWKMEIEQKFSPLYFFF